MAGASYAYYELDPDGDLLLILRNPSPPFAVWADNLDALTDKHTQGSSGASGSSINPSASLRISRRRNKAALDNKKIPAAITENDAQTSGQSEPEQPSSLQKAELSAPGLEEKASAPPPTDETPPSQPYVEILLSSAHLRLGSGYFKRTLKNGWKEAVTYNEDGKRYMEAEDFDAEALLTVMRLIHNLDNSVPREVDLEMLAKIAVVVDYYDCHEAVQFFAATWIDALKDDLPSTCNRELSLWLLISSVFKEDDVFYKITETAVLRSTMPLRNLDLPIRQIFIDLIDWRRQDAINLIITALEDLHDSLREANTGCNAACSSLLLGALIKGTRQFLSPSPEEPYLGYSIETSEKALRDIPKPDWGSIGSSHTCYLKTPIFSRLKGDFEECKKGFELREALMPDVVKGKKEDETVEGQ